MPMELDFRPHMSLDLGHLAADMLRFDAQVTLLIAQEFAHNDIDLTPKCLAHSRLLSLLRPDFEPHMSRIVAHMMIILMLVRDEYTPLCSTEYVLS